MTILQTIIDNVGDLLGTSNLARLNKRVFKPVLGISINRNEYEMCNGANMMDLPDRQETRQFRSLNGYERQRTADAILEEMVANGTVFSDRRIHMLAAKQQSVPGQTDLTYTVQQQLSSSGDKLMKRALNYQNNRAALARRQLS